MTWYVIYERPAFAFERWIKFGVCLGRTVVREQEFVAGWIVLSGDSGRRMILILSYQPKWFVCGLCTFASTTDVCMYNDYDELVLALARFLLNYNDASVNTLRCNQLQAL